MSGDVFQKPQDNESRFAIFRLVRKFRIRLKQPDSLLNALRFKVNADLD